MGLLDSISSFASSAADAVGGAVSSAANYVYEIGGDVLNGVYNSMGTAWTAGTNVFDDYFDLGDWVGGEKAGASSSNTSDALFSNSIADQAIKQWSDAMPNAEQGDSAFGGLIDFAKSESGQNLAKLGLGYLAGREKQKSAEKLIEKAEKARKKFRGAYYV